MAHLILTRLFTAVSSNKKVDTLFIRVKFQKNHTPFHRVKIASQGEALLMRRGVLIPACNQSS